MELATLIHQYRHAFEDQYANRVLPSHHNAIKAMLRCRTPHAGEIQLQCSDCPVQINQPQSCGHRSCPKCQNHTATQWLDRQRAKLLPVEYFMITFTLPAELRTLAWQHQSVIYNLLFDTAISTLKDFGRNPKHLGADIGMTAVLHTHSRRLDFHPHLHVIVPGGGLHQTKRQWLKIKGHYLFNGFALAKVFRARFLAALNDTGLPIPTDLPIKWVVHCNAVGKGHAALEYLSVYLYRGVISEKNIVANRNGNVTFKYIEARTGNTLTRTLKGEDFLWLILQHVLPRGFRRVRDYGFLHGNAKRRLTFVQLVLRVVTQTRATHHRPVFKCPMCQSPMRILAFVRTSWRPG